MWRRARFKGNRGRKEECKEKLKCVEKGRNDTGDVLVLPQILLLDQKLSSSCASVYGELSFTDLLSLDVTCLLIPGAEDTKVYKAD